MSTDWTPVDEETNNYDPVDMMKTALRYQIGHDPNKPHMQW